MPGSDRRNRSIRVHRRLLAMKSPRNGLRHRASNGDAPAVVRFARHRSSVTYILSDMFFLFAKSGRELSEKTLAIAAIHVSTAIL